MTETFIIKQVNAADKQCALFDNAVANVHNAPPHHDKCMCVMIPAEKLKSGADPRELERRLQQARDLRKRAFKQYDHHIGSTVGRLIVYGLLAGIAGLTLRFVIWSMRGVLDALR